METEKYALVNASVCVAVWVPCASVPVFIVVGFVYLLIASTVVGGEKERARAWHSTRLLRYTRYTIPTSHHNNTPSTVLYAYPPQQHTVVAAAAAAENGKSIT